MVATNKDGDIQCSKRTQKSYLSESIDIVTPSDWSQTEKTLLFVADQENLFAVGDGGNPLEFLGEGNKPSGAAGDDVNSLIHCRQSKPSGGLLPWLK